VCWQEQRFRLPTACLLPFQIHRLSSYATCALLHLEACLHHHPARGGGPGPGAAVLGALGAQAAADLGALLDELWPFGGAPGGPLFGPQSGAQSGWRPAASYADGVQLLVPGDPHHWAVARGQPEPGGPGRMLESITAAATAALASATEDLGQSSFGGGGGGGGGGAGARPGGGAAPPGAARDAGLRAAAAALRGEDLFCDSGLATVPACAVGAGVGLSTIASADGCGDGAPAPPPGPPPAIGPDWQSAGLPDFDVVFIHGVRGGPFVTWRRGDVLARGAARASLTHGDCWPAAWMAGDLPGARLLSIEYHVRAGVGGRGLWVGLGCALGGPVHGWAERRG
jgi:hypothetical protein